MYFLGTKRWSHIQSLPVAARINSSQAATPDGAVWDGREAETSPAEGACATGCGS